MAAGMTKKHHHYLPKAYLKAFCDAKGKVCLYRKDNPGQLIHQRPGKVCFHRYYYSQPLSEGGKDHDRLEDLFSKLETTWPCIVKRLEQRENVNDCLGDIFDFIALQRARVPAARDASEAILSESVKASLRRLGAAGRLPPKPEGYADILEHVDVAINPHQSIHAIVHMFTGVRELLQQIGIGALHNRTNIPFLTSDNPVVWFDPSVAEDDMRPYVIRKGGPIVLLFPVTPKLMLYGHSSVREQFAQNGFSHGELSECSKVEAMNRQICRFAYEAILSQGLVDEPLIRRYAEVSPVVQTQRITYKDGEFLFSQYVWERRTRKPKWVDQGSRPDTEPGRSESCL